LLAALGGTQQMRRRHRLENDDIRLRARHAEVTAKVRSSNHRVEEFHFQKTLWERTERSPAQTMRPLVLLYASNEATCSAMKVKQAKRTEDSKMDNFRRDEKFLYELEEMEKMEFEHRGSEPGESRFGNSRSVRAFVGKVLSTFSHDFHDFYWRFEPYDCSLIAPKGTETKTPLDLEKQKQARAIAMRFFQESWPEWRKMPFNWPDQTKVILNPESSESKRRSERLPDLREIWAYWSKMGLSTETLRVLQAYSLEVKLTPRIMIRRRVGLLSLSQLSDGEQRLFSLFVDIARQLLIRNPSDRVGGGEAIVMIDEIDVHLHPKWQRIIVPALQELFLQCQFIATTHSPFVIQSLDPGELISLDKTAEVLGEYSNQSIEDIVEGVQGVDMPQRNHRAEVLSSAVEEYVKELRKPKVSTAAVKRAEIKYREASEPYSPNPGLNALLKLEALAAVKPKSK